MYKMFPIVQWLSSEWPIYILYVIMLLTVILLSASVYELQLVEQARV